MEEFILNAIEEVSFTSVELDDPLWSSGVLDSITIVELSVELENEFDIKIPIEEIVVENFETARKILTFIQSKK